MSWKRVRKSLKSKRNEEEFSRSKALIDQLIIAYKTHEIDLYYFDESGFSLTPSVPYAWQTIGEHIEIPSATSKRFNVLGFIDRKCQFDYYIFEGHVNTDVVISYFNQFAKKLSKTTVVLIDNASMHTSDKFDKQTVIWCEQGLVVVPISRYSPELNIIEILWRKIKYEWMPFSAYQSIDKLHKYLSSILAVVGSEYYINFS
jgi:transposase